MNRTLIFDSPFLLGFDHLRDLVDRAQRAATEGYPPYNVEELGEGRLRITLAVAGFSPDQLQVTVEDNQLVVSGKREAAQDANPAAERAYLHRGIAARAFVRSFVLAQGMEIDGADLAHGLLHIDVVRRPLEASIKRIPIRAAP